MALIYESKRMTLKVVWFDNVYDWYIMRIVHIMVTTRCLQLHDIQF